MGYYGFVEPDNKIIAYAPNTVLVQEERLKQRPLNREWL